MLVSLKKIKTQHSLLSTGPFLCYKIFVVFKMITNRQITKFCNENNVLPEQQFGFKLRHSIAYAVRKITFDMNKAIYENKYVPLLLASPPSLQLFPG